MTYGMRTRSYFQDRPPPAEAPPAVAALRSVEEGPSLDDSLGTGGAKEAAYEPPEPHLRFWEQKGSSAGPTAFEVEMNADRSLAAAVQYTVTLEAEKTPGTYRLADVNGELVTVEGAGPDGTIVYEKGTASPPRIRVTFSTAAVGRAPSECFSVVLQEASSAAKPSSTPLPISFAPDISDHRALVTRSAKIGDPSALTASVSGEGLLTVRCKDSSKAPTTLLRGSLRKAPEPFGFGKAVYAPEFKATDPKTLSAAFVGASTVFSGLDGSSGPDVIYSWTGEPPWTQGGEPSNERAVIVRDLPVPRSFSPLSPGPKWIAVMQLSDGGGALFRITYAVVGEDSGVPGYFKEGRGSKGGAKCGTITGVAGASGAACPKECALACDSLDDCAGFAWDLPGDDAKACASFCGKEAAAGRCRLLGAQSLAAKGAEGTDCVQQVYVKTAVPPGFSEAASVTGRTRRGEAGGGSGGPDGGQDGSCFKSCDAKSLADCSSVGLSPARTPSFCATYPLGVSADKRTFQVFGKALPAARLGPGETAGPPPPDGYLVSPPESRRGTILHTAAAGASSLRECAAKCLGDASCAAFSWGEKGSGDDSASKVCMLIPDDQDPVYDREPVFCGEYDPLFKYVPMPMPPGRHAGPTYPPSRPVDDPSDTTCKGPDCKHQCEMDCLRACDTDDGCYGFVVAPTDPADPAAGMYCRMIREEGVHPEAATDESPRTGVISFRKVLDGSSYDPLKSGGACTDICGGDKGKSRNGLFCGGGAGSEADAVAETKAAAEEMETSGAESKKDDYRELHRLFGQSPSKGTLDYDAATENQCAAKCDVDTDCVMFSWDPFAQTSALTGRKSGCRLLSAEDFDRSSYSRTLITGRRPNRVAIKNYEKKNWNAVTTKAAD